MQTQRAVARTGPSSKLPRPSRPDFKTRALASHVRTSFGPLSGLADIVKFAPLLLFGLIAIGLIGLALAAVVQRVVAPTAQVIVSPFQVSADLAKQLTITGDAISEMVSDNATTITVEGAQFHGLNPGSSGKHFGRLPLSVEIPVKTSIPFAIKGISIDDLVQVYDRLRYDQITVSGDLYSDRGAVQLRMRAEGGKLDGVPIVTTVDPTQPVTDALKLATIRLMTRVNPALVGRMYLFEHDTPEAVTVFREWANSDPLNPEPTFFMAYTYDIDNDLVQKLHLSKPEALIDSRLMADWSLKIASYRNVCRGFVGNLQCTFQRARYSLRKSSPKAADRARASLGAVFEDTGEYLAEANQYQQAGEQYREAAEQYRQLERIYPEDTNLRINHAQAELDESLVLKRGDLMTQAAQELRIAERLAPDNPLVEQDLGAALSDSGQMQEAIGHERDALLLAPFYFQPFANAVEMLWESHRYSEASDLCRSTYLLDQRRRPDGSATAGTEPSERNTKLQCAYVIAFSGSVQKSLEIMSEAGLGRDVSEAALREWATKQSAEVNKQINTALDDFDKPSATPK